MDIKIVGSGSIGNHLAHAARNKGWSVTIEDIDSAALSRMKDEIYPNRYGRWDSEIRQILSGEDSNHNYDMIFIGTPPDVRLEAAKRNLERHHPKMLQLEKVISDPDITKLRDFLDVLARTNKEVKVLVGYDHAVGRSFNAFLGYLKSSKYKEITSIAVQFRENWQGILNAHPWLKGPWESYLGYTDRGGGAASEHSHALHLLIYFLESFGDKISSYTGGVNYVLGDNGCKYDDHFSFEGQTEHGKNISCGQDVVAIPTKKEFRITYRNNGTALWECAYNGQDDRITLQDVPGISDTVLIVNKTRKDDFGDELVHIDDVFRGTVPIEKSPLKLDLAVKVLEIISSSI